MVCLAITGKFLAENRMARARLLRCRRNLQYSDDGDCYRRRLLVDAGVNPRPRRDTRVQKLVRKVGGRRIRNRNVVHASLSSAASGSRSWPTPGQGGCDVATTG